MPTPLSYAKLQLLQERFAEARDESSVYQTAMQIQDQVGRMVMFSALTARYLEGTMTIMRNRYL